jgi:hypothetical protein
MNNRSQDSSVGIATGYGLESPGSIPCRKQFFCFSQRPDRLWGPPRLLSNRYRASSSRGLSGRVVKLTTHLYLVPRSRKLKLYFHSPICLHGIVLNYLSTGITLKVTTTRRVTYHDSCPVLPIRNCASDWPGIPLSSTSSLIMCQ